MNTDPEQINRPDYNLERDQVTVVDAAQHIAELIAKAPQEVRIELVKTLDNTLKDADVLVIDTSGIKEDERKGKQHPAYTRPMVIALIKAREERRRRDRASRPSIWHEL